MQAAPAGWARPGKASARAESVVPQAPLQRVHAVVPVRVQGTGRGNGQDDDEHDIPDYLKDLEHFTDGRVVAPPVIGADDPS